MRDKKLNSEKISEAQDLHDKLRNILIEYGSEEFGDCIVDDICQLFSFPTTIDIESDEEKL